MVALEDARNAPSVFWVIERLGLMYSGDNEVYALLALTRFTDDERFLTYPLFRRQLDS